MKTNIKDLIDNDLRLRKFKKSKVKQKKTTHPDYIKLLIDNK
jgi:hypothetical protein